MKISYSFTRADLLKIRIFLVLSSRRVQIFSLLNVAFWIFIGMSQKSQEPISLTSQLVVAGIGSCCSIAAGIGAMVLFFAIRVFWGDNEGALGEHSLQITPEGLEETTKYNTSLSRWTGLRKLKKRAGFLFIYFPGQMGYVVPIRRPMLEGDLNGFVPAIETRLRG